MSSRRSVNIKKRLTETSHRASKKKVRHKFKKELGQHRLGKNSAPKLRYERIRALHEIGTAISSSLDLQAVMNIAAKKIQHFLPYASGFIRLLNSKTGLLEPAVSWNLKLSDGELAKWAKGGITAATLNSQRPLYIEDVRKDPRNTHLDIAIKYGLVSYLGFPLAAKGEKLGDFFFQTKDKHQFTVIEIDFLSTLAGQLALAIYNSRLFSRVTQQAKELAAINDDLKTRSRQQAVLAHIGRLALARNDLAALLNEIARLVAVTLQAEYSEVLELLPDGEALLLRAGVGWKKGCVGQATVGAGTDSQAGYALLSNMPVIVEDLQEETRFRAPPLLNDHGVRSGICVVIHGREPPFGVLGVDTSKRRTFTETEAQFLQGAANMLATALEHARTEELKSQLAAIVESSEDAVIGRTLEGIITSWNRGAEAIYGYSAEEAMGRSISMLIPADQRNVIELNREKILRGDPIEHYDALRIRKDGEPTHVSLTVSPIRNAEGMVIGASIISRDITTKKRAEEEIGKAKERFQILSRHLLQIQETERRHLARELHDEIGQALTALKINLQMKLQTVRKSLEFAAAEPRIVDNIAIVDRLLEQVRGLAVDLRPAILDDLGLMPALRWYMDHRVRQAGIEARLMADPPELDVQAEVGTACFRIVQEALTNVIRHARASQVSVRLHQLDGRLNITINDDGVGFDVLAVRDSFTRGEGIGLLGMEERVLLMRGQIEIKSEPTRGTEVCVSLPLGLKTPSSGREV